MRRLSLPVKVGIGLLLLCLLGGISVALWWINNNVIRFSSTLDGK